MQSQMRHCIKRCLIRTFTVCLQNVLLKSEKNKCTTEVPENCKWARPTVKGRPDHFGLNALKLKVIQVSQNRLL